MKKTFTRIAAAIASAAILAPMNSNAIFSLVHEDDGEIANRIEGYTQVEGIHFFDWANSSGNDYDAMYVNETGSEFIAFRKYDGIDIMVEPSDKTDREKIAEILHELYNKNYNISPVPTDSSKCYIRNYGESPKITISMAAEMIQLFKEKGLIKSGKIYTERYQEYSFEKTGKYANYVTTYYNLDKNFDLYGVLKDYAEKELAGYTVEKSDSNSNICYVSIIPPEGTTLIEQIETAEKIYEATQKAPYYESPASNSTIGLGVINAYDYISGDANCDSNTTVADSVAILQNIGNNDKYKLSAQGKFNADVDGEEGVTANDALTIQQWDSQGKL